VQRNVEKMRLLYNELRNVEIIKLRLILYERMDNEKSYSDKSDVVCYTTDIINFFVVQSDKLIFSQTKSVGCF